MIIAIASGKGGTGKTTLAVNLARVLAQSGHSVDLLDCDVEAPDAHLFLGLELKMASPVEVLVPEVLLDKCAACGVCAGVCQFGAIAVVGGHAVVFPELCHSCGACVEFCTSDALRERPYQVGTLWEAEAGGLRLLQGRLNIGEPMAVPVVKAVRGARRKGDITLIDASPGSSCPVIAAVRGADAALLVTEPTPFGLHDLKQAVAVMRLMEMPFAVVLNRMGIGDLSIQDYCRSEEISILMEIPNDVRIAKAYAQGKLIIDALPEYQQAFTELWQKVKAMVPRSKTACQEQ